MTSTTEPFWMYSPESIFRQLHASPSGLNSKEAAKRLRQQNSGLQHRWERFSGLILLLNQFKSPLVLILVFAVGLSTALGDTANALIIAVILLFTGLMGFWQEYKANRAVQRLQAMVRTTALVRRDGSWQKTLLREVVPGDLIRLVAGDIVPGDCLLLKAKDLHVNESALTGESFPAEKMAGPTSDKAALRLRFGQRSRTHARQEAARADKRASEGGGAPDTAGEDVGGVFVSRKPGVML